MSGRALAGAAAMLCAAAGLVAWALVPGDERPPAVIATFDDAAYLVPGQELRIAGAVAGKVRSVRLTATRKAAVSLDVDARFTPFHTDARCTIRPQSLIGERYVDCSPGTPRGALLPRDRDGAQLLPVTRTSAPVDLDLVLDTLDRPVSQRLALILTDLGAGLSGRAEELSATIHRAAPALDDANRLLSVLDRDRQRIGRLVEDTDAVLAGVAARRAAVPRFISRAHALTAVTARRRRELAATLERLPALLRAARGSLQQLRGAAADGLPVVRDVGRAAPGVNATVAAITPLSVAGQPALARLAASARGLRPAVRALRPLAAAARPFAKVAAPTGGLVDELLTSLRERGATRGILRFLENSTLATSRFDDVSHVLTATQLTGSCSTYATTPSVACSAHFASGKAQALRVARSTPARERKPQTGRKPALTPTPRPLVPASPPATPVLELPGLPPIELPQVAQDATQALGPLLDLLLR